MNNITFTEVAAEDAETITGLAREIWPAVYADMISSEQIEYMLAWMYAPAKIRSEIAEEIIYLFIQSDGTNIGYLAFGPVNQGEICQIHKIYVSPAYHRKGIGTAAMNEIELRATRARAKSMELRVNRTNESGCRLYTKAGFSVVAEDCADIGSGFVMDDYIFAKSIQG